MHPFTAIWTWSNALLKAGPAKEVSEASPSETEKLIPVGGYLQTEITATPLSNELLDRLAEIYWNERDRSLRG